MSPDTFVYVTYINTTRERLWEALTAPAFTRRYWVGCWQDTDWRVGSPWKLTVPDGRVADSGEVLEFEPPSRFAVSWRHDLTDAFRGAGVTRARFDLEDTPNGVKLTVIHEGPASAAKLIEALAQGWPGILSSLKTLMETGEALPGTDKWPEGM